MKLPKFISNNLQSISSQFSNPKPNSILYNRFVLYLVFAISLFQLYTFSVAGKLAHIAMFLLVAFLTSFFSKNMTVILVIALVFTEIIRAGIPASRLEGMVEGNDDKKEPTKKESDNETVKEGAVDKKPEETPKNPEEEKMDKPEKKETKTESLEDLKKTQEELKKNQDKIIQGFQEIEPYMNKAESLVTKINEAYTKK